MKGKEKKFEKTLPVEEACSLVATLASGLRGEAAGQLEGLEIDLKDFTSLKMSLERKNDLIAIKLKVKTAQAKEKSHRAKNASPKEEKSKEIGDNSDGNGLPDYKKLKKRMKKSFKALSSSAREGSLPDEKVLGAFIEDSGIMVQYPDKGEEFYEEYKSSVTELDQAFKQSDLIKFQAAVDALNKIQKKSHEKYK